MAPDRYNAQPAQAVQIQAIPAAGADGNDGMSGGCPWRCLPGKFKPTQRGCSSVPDAGELQWFSTPECRCDGCARALRATKP